MVTMNQNNEQRQGILITTDEIDFEAQSKDSKAVSVILIRTKLCQGKTYPMIMNNAPVCITTSM